MDTHLDCGSGPCGWLALLGRPFVAAALLACENGPAEPSRPQDPATAIAGPSLATFADGASTPFGTFNGIAYLRHTGFFEGVTTLGEFRVPYEIIAPDDPSLGNGTVLVEPPHFAFGPVGRDVVLGRGFLFASGLSYAAVGFGEHGRNILDPTASGLVLAGAPVANPGAFNPAGTLDEEIIVQFSQALTSESFAVEILGPAARRYAFGSSQTAAVLLETQRSVAGTESQGLFDLTVLYVALWHAPFPGEQVFDFLSGEFEPLGGVGRVLFVESEGDQVISDAEQFRRAVGEPGYRVYELAGAAHLPAATNPLDHAPVVRALFVAGDRWVRSGMEPPPSTLLEAAPGGQIDPVYGFETGIARDGDLNALGGVRLPDLAVARARFIASDPATLPPGIPPVFAILTGNMVDLACEPAPGSTTDEPRFRTHGAYVNAFTRQVNELQSRGFLLGADAEVLKQRAAESAVGAPDSCG